MMLPSTLGLLIKAELTPIVNETEIGSMSFPDSASK